MVVDDWEDILKVWHDLAKKIFVPGLGWDGVGVGLWFGWVFPHFKDQYKWISSPSGA